MFAIIAALCFLFALLVDSPINLVTLGLLFVALHLAIGPVISIPSFRRNP